MPRPMRFPRLPEVVVRPRATSSFRSRAIAALTFLLLPLGAHTTFAQPKPPPMPAGPKPPPATTQTAAPTSTARPAGPRPATPSKPPPSASSTAAAAPPEPIEGGDEVGRLYAEGYAAFQAGDFLKAEAILTKAWGLSRSFDVAGALGSAKLEAGKHRDAAQYLSFALRNALPSTRAGVRDRIKRDLDGARQKLATIKLTVSLVEARIAVDGAGIDPIFVGPEIFVEPGKRTFQATAEGYTPASSTLDTKAGEIYVVNLKLERSSGPKSGAVPPAPTEQSTPLPAALLGGVGGAAIVAGAVLIGAAESSKANAYDLARNTLTPDGKRTCPKAGPGPTELCDQVRAAAASADAFGNAGMGVFIGAGALLAGATVYMLFIRPEPAAPAAEGGKAPGPTSQIVPVVGTTGGGFVWRGSF